MQTVTEWKNNKTGVAPVSSGVQSVSQWMVSRPSSIQPVQPIETPKVGFWDVIKGIPQAAVNLYKPLVEKVVQPFLTPTQNILQKGQEFVNALTEPSSMTEKIKAGVSLVIAGTSIPFTPFIAPFEAASKVPVLKDITGGIDEIFKCAGVAVNFFPDKFIDAIPNSVLEEKDRENVKSTFNEITNTAVQIWLGAKVIDGITKGIKITPEKITELKTEALKIPETIPETKLPEIKSEIKPMSVSEWKDAGKPTAPEPKPVSAIPKELEPLAQEARKYKSAEEFVKGQSILYHGTSAKFETFDETMKGSITGAKSAKGAIWFTDDPATAKAYSVYAAEEGPVLKLQTQIDAADKIARKSGLESDWKKYDILVAKQEQVATYDVSYQRRLTQANVKEATIKGDFYTVDAKGKTPQELSADGDIDSWLNLQLDKAKKLGKDGVIFKNLDDAVGLTDVPSTHYAVFDPKNIKTKSQLTDFYTQATKGIKEVGIPKEPLAQEARKYKSAEEFVNKFIKIQKESGKRAFEDPYLELKKITPEEEAFRQKVFEYTSQPEIIKKYEAGATDKEILTDFYTQATKGIGEVKPEITIPPKPIETTSTEQLTSRVFERIQAEHPQVEGELGYDPIKLKADAQKAVDLIATDKQKAYDIAMGKETSPDITSTAVNIAMSEKALGEGNIDLYSRLVRNRSLEQTRRGQEIVAERGSITDNSTSKYVKELIAARLEALGKKYLSGLKEIVKKTDKGKATDIINKEVAKVEEKIRTKKLDVKSALDLLELLTCL